MTFNGRPRRILQWVATIVYLLMGSRIAVAGPLTVAEAIQTSRIMAGPGQYATAEIGSTSKEQGLAKSPDGRRYAFMLVRGDIERNGNWFEFAVGSLEGVGEARPHFVAHLFSTSLGQSFPSNVFALSFYDPIAWIDNDHISFLWEDQRGIRQVASIDTTSGKFAFVTNSPTSVVSYSFNSKGFILYSARAPAPPDRSAELKQKGFSVVSEDLLDALSGRIDLPRNATWTQATEMFVLSAVDASPIKLGGLNRGSPQTAQNAVYSPDGLSAAVDLSAENAKPDWAKYRDSGVTLGGKDLRSLEATRQIHVIDLGRGTVRPLWNAPLPSGRGSKYIWSPNSDTLLVGPSYVPLNENGTNTSADAMAVVNVRDGTFALLPIGTEQLSPITTSAMWSVSWVDNQTISVSVPSGKGDFTRVDGTWRVAKDMAATMAVPAAGIEVKIVEDLNTPPKIYGVGADGGEALLFDPNPALGRELSLGRVEEFVWMDKAGRRWEGHLYYPTNYRPNAQYPLVIYPQAPGSLEKFSLYGHSASPALGPSGPIYAAQALANRGIMVLEIGDPAFFDKTVGTLQELHLILSGYEAAIDALAAKGSIDRRNIGIAGWSRNGFWVDYLITHSHSYFAAALTADNYDGGYFGQVLVPFQHSPYGVEPEGKGLQVWLREAPAFLFDEKFATPLRIELDTGGLSWIASQWEPFARLRQFKRPVELYVIPDIEHGVHVLQNPAQVLASDGGAVDWFDFWLNGHEDSDPAKAEQYQRWEVLCDLQRAQKPKRPAFCVSKMKRPGSPADID